MKIDYLPRALAILDDAPAEVRKAFFKQVKLLEQNLRHPSLKAKKYDESQDAFGKLGLTGSGASISRLKVTHTSSLGSYPTPRNNRSNPLRRYPI